ncbi:MAG: DNA modification methylase [Dehalococcoidia bacterium]|nr:DNA modification methylase [Dehalococcoidia bacterium]
MNIDDLIRIYDKKRERYGAEAYRQVSNVLREAKEQHEREFGGVDHEQSWRAFKGRNLEKLIKYVIIDEVRELGLEVVNGNTIERTNSRNLPKGLSKVKRNLLVDYGEFGCYLPDIDLIIYRPDTSEIVAILSSKVTLRERIAQTGYWKIKLASDEATRHIKVYFVTPDEDGTLRLRRPAKKGRAIVETDTDGGYVLSEADVEESDKVKMLDKFIDDLRRLLR